ncbi:MAG: MtrB/PioB family decaheme-associated outer membrane protein [Woeseiaceae bacterium]|nr:MtrB/PioB family decaheme-associated outer membrane protein [Woeseiaceae bacterium]
MMKLNKDKTNSIRPILGLVIFVAFVATDGARAQAVDTSDWNCEFCPFPDGYEADVAIGATSISDDSARLGNATGYDESGAYANVDGQGLYAGESIRLTWMAEDLGLDSRRLAIEGGRPGSFGFRLDWSELPYRLFNTTQTVYDSVGNDTLVLPSGWVPAARTQNMPGLAAALTPIDIASDRQAFGVGVDVEAVSDFDFYADFRRQQRDGIRIMGGSAFFQAALLPRVIDYETDLVDAGIRYASGPFSVSVAWFGSFFTNNAGSLTWDNPFPGFRQGRHALEPDNDFQQLSVSGTYHAGALNTVVAFTAANGRGEQDANLLPYTIDSGIVAPGLPRATADAEVDTTNLALSITSRPFPKARVRLNYRYDERDNGTPQAMWQRVVVDSVLAPGSDANIPYSYERSVLALDASYRLFDGVRIAGGYERRDIDRDFQEVAEQAEDTGYGQLWWQPTPALELRLKGGTARREPERYDEAFAVLNGQNPLLRKYHLAYRYREFAEAMLAFAPTELPVSASLMAYWADDSYSRSELGLLAGDSLTLAGDLSWAASERVSLYLHVSEEGIDAEQAGSTLFAAPNWTARHDDDYTAIGAGVRIRDIGAKFDVTFDYSSASGESEIIVDGPGAGPSEFPELESQYDDLRLTLSYRSSPRLAWTLEVRYQLFETEDWALEGLAPATARSLLSLGAAPWDEDVLAVGLGIRYRIGSAAEE